ncbi:MAG: hypothetical protein HOG97_07080 [Candidatus Marinimicrobia bacterium]|nr:hypothetical protein [Candidatus Neomarinimicrobiota bacterium]
MKKKYIYNYIMVTLLILLQFAWTNTPAIGSIFSISGFVQIVSTDRDVPPSQAVNGRTIYSDDIIRTAKDSFCKIIYNDRTTLVIVDPSSEIKLSDSQLSRNIHLHFGGMYLKNARANRKKSFIFTKSSQIKLKPVELWMAVSEDGGDEVHIIKHNLEVFNLHQNKKMKIVSGNVVYSYKDGFFETIKSNLDELPSYLFNSQLLSLHDKKKPEEFKIQEINYRSHDLIPLFGLGRWREKTIIEPSGFGMDLLVGKMDIGSDTYSKIGVYPRYNTRNFNLKFNFDGYLPSGNSSIDLNKIDDVYDVFDHLSYLQYSSKHRNFLVKIGSIDGISFGHGNLVKEYSNMLDYPRSKKTGVYMFLTTDTRNFSVDLFTASLRDFNEGGGVVGLHGSMFLSEYFPLTIGLGFVRDFNQFASVKDFISDENILNKNFSRGITAWEIDFTMDVYHNFLFDIYVYGELVGVWFPETHYYIREETTIETESCFPGYSFPCSIFRDGTWGINFPGVWVKYHHWWEFKFAFNLNSALHIPQYFGTTYDYERVRYTQYQSPSENPYADDAKDMLMEYALEDGDIVSEEVPFLLPKDIHSMTDHSQIKFPSLGYSFEAVYHFKKLVDANCSFSLFKDYTDSNSDSFYNYHLSLALQDNVLEYVSEAKVYYTQFFTNAPFDNEIYHENMLRGVKLGFKIIKSISIVVDYHDVFYDKEPDGIVDLVRTGGIDLKLNF